MTVTKTTPDAEVPAGDEIVFVVEVVNSVNSDSSAYEVQVTDGLPTGPGIDWAIEDVFPAGRCSISLADVVLCHMDELLPAARISFTVVSPTTTESCGTYRNEVVASWNDTPPIEEEAMSAQADHSLPAEASITVTCGGPPGGGGGGGGGGDSGLLNVDSAGAGFGVQPMASKSKAPKFNYTTKKLSPKNFKMRLGDDIWFRDLDDGIYTVTQEGLKGWRLKKIVCEGDPTGEWKANVKKRKLTVEIIAGSHLFCTFVNARK